MSTWDAYWAWVGGNIGAMPLEALITLAAAWLLRDEIGRRLAAWWAKHHGPHAVEQHLEALRRHEEERGG